MKGIKQWLKIGTMTLLVAISILTTASIAMESCNNCSDGVGMASEANIIAPAASIKAPDANLVYGSPVPLMQSFKFTASGYTAAGVGMRNLGHGTIDINIPEGSTIQKAYLYWSVMNGFDSSSLSIGNLNDKQIIGTLIAKTGNPCWSGEIYNFRADVTNYVASGTNTLNGFASGLWGFYPLLEGATLVVLYDNPNMPSQTILLYDGGVTFGYQKISTVITDFETTTSAKASTTFIVADGQHSGYVGLNNKVYIGDTLLADHTLNGAGPGTQYWDTLTLNVDIPAGSKSATLSVESSSDGGAFDCITWVAQVLSIPSASSGRVTTSDGRGIAGVTMTFLPVSTKNAKVPLPVTTDEKGYWSQKGFSPGVTYRVMPSDPISGGVNYIFKSFYLDFVGLNANLNFVGTPAISGIDLSYPAGDVSPKTWKKLYDDGYKFVIVGGWGGRGQNQYAQKQLQTARCVGFKTATYTFLSFENSDQTGDWQVKQTLKAVGDKEKRYLSFNAIDVELPCNNGNCWAVNVKPEDRTREAVKAVEDSGLRPMIYTSRYYWNTVLGLSEITEFGYLPLWNSGSGSNPSLQKGWVSYGGWDGSTGKQYILDTYREGVKVDLDTFDPSMFPEMADSSCTSVESGTGKGTIYFDTDAGTIENLVSINPSSIPVAPPKSAKLYYGLFRFDITGLTPGGSATITLLYPDSPSKASKKYWKYGATADNAEAHWYNIPSTVEGYRQTITLVDGGIGDDDLMVNGRITDDGGPSIDNIPPSTAITMTGTLGNEGWYLSGVEVNLSAQDDEDGSGVNITEYSFDNITWNTYTAPFNITNEGITTIYYYSTDNAGNIESTKNLTIKIDKTPPQVTITTPANGSQYTLNQMVLANWSVNDSVSGIASITATALNGKAIDTYTVGSKTFSVNPTDNAGNQANKTVTYSVIYNYSGVLPPINASGSSNFKLGSTIPVKFQLWNANRNNISTATARIYLTNITNGATGKEINGTSSGNTNTGNLFRYDSTSNQYIFNLATKPLSIGTWRIRISVDDGTSKYVTVGLKS